MAAMAEATERQLWVFVEPSTRDVSEASLEALSAARRLADEGQNPVQVAALVLGAAVDTYRETLARHGADRIYTGEVGAGYLPEALAQRVAAAWEASDPRPVALIFPGSRVGREVATRVAALCRLAFAAQVIRIRWHEDNLEVDSLAFANKVQITYRGPHVIALHPETFPVRPARRAGEVLPLPGEAPTASRVTLVAFRKADPRTVPLEQAEFIVAGGNGVKNFRLIWEFADLVGAAVGGSRVVCDDGRLERSRQIGESGVIVSPRCYIAVGISGAIQHVRGMQNSEIVITINIDRHAPIHDLASLAVIGDAHAVLEALIRKLKERQRAKTAQEA